MKKVIIAFTAILCLASTSTFSQTITSVSNGNFLNPLTWDCTCIPLPGADVTVAHNVTLDTDIGYTSGSLTVNGGASLVENTPRNFAMSGGAFTNNGTTDISTVAFFAGTAENHGSMRVDSNFLLTTAMLNTGTLYDIDSLGFTATLTNTSTGTITAEQLGLSGLSAGLLNDGTINNWNFWNDGWVTNNGVMNVDTNFASTEAPFINDGTLEIGQDCWVAQDFINGTNATVNIGRDFLFADSLGNTIAFENNGWIWVGDDWANGDIMQGDGHWCVQDSTYNTGSMTGTFDFCDLTGGNVDFNTGTIAGTITYCTASCNVGIADAPSLLTIDAYPNPFEGTAILTLSEESPQSVSLQAYDQSGRLVECDYSVNGNQIEISRSDLNPGVYYFRASTAQATGTVIMVIR